MGMTESIDTNFNFNPSLIYPIVKRYGDKGRAFYIRQRWTFDLVFPLVYGVPFWLTMKKFLPRVSLEKFHFVADLALVATAFDYLENIVFTILVALYPTEIGVLPVIGIVMSLFKWTSLSLAMVSTLGVSIAVLVGLVSDAIFGTVNMMHPKFEPDESFLEKFTVVL